MSIALTVWAAAVAAVTAEAPAACGIDKIWANTGLAGGGMQITALLNVTSLDECCAMCHGQFHDECFGWTYGPVGSEDSDLPPHNCCLFASFGNPRTVANHTSGIVPGAPPPGPPAPGPPGPPCRADIDCAPITGATWRCKGNSALPKTPEDNCHLPGPGTRGNSTCSCAVQSCSSTPASTNLSAVQYLMIGDSISLGMESDLKSLVAAHGWDLTHSPGNAASSNLGAHCMSDWLERGNRTKWDVLSYNFGLHDLGYDTERISVEQYTALMRNITADIAQLQKSGGVDRVLWVTTTPVPTVPVYDQKTCNNTATCVNPPRFDSDVVLFNEAAAQVVAAANSAGASIETADLYSFVLKKCGGKGYAHCDGFQLPANVHYTPDGWTALATEMASFLLKHTLA